MKNKMEFIQKEDMITDVGEIMKSKTDPDGWYTGVTTTDEYDLPVQDADDL